MNPDAKMIIQPIQAYTRELAELLNQKTDLRPPQKLVDQQQWVFGKWDSIVVCFRAPPGIQALHQHLWGIEERLYHERLSVSTANITLIQELELRKHLANEYITRWRAERLRQNAHEMLRKGNVLTRDMFARYCVSFFAGDWMYYIIDLRNW